LIGRGAWRREARRSLFGDQHLHPEDRTQLKLVWNAVGSVLDFARRKQRHDALLDLLDQLAVSGRMERIAVLRQVREPPASRNGRWGVGARRRRRSRRQYIHLDVDGRKRGWPPQVRAARLCDHEVALARSEFEQHLAHLLPQAIAGVLRGES